MSKKDNTQRGRIIYYIGLLSIELYYPYFYKKTANFGFSADTMLNVFTYLKDEDWMLTRSAAMKIIGFGFGLAWKHCSNPNEIERRKLEDD